MPSTRHAVILFAIFTLGGCACRMPDGSPFGVVERGPRPSDAQVDAAIAAWPGDFHRTCFMTLCAGGRQLPLSGVVERQVGTLRIVAVTDLGMVLADLRADQNTCKVARTVPGLDASFLEMLGRDLALALKTPRQAPSADDDALRLRYSFGPSGRPQLLEARGLPPGELRVHYARYDGIGRWREVNLCRPGRYVVQFTFTDD